MCCRARSLHCIHCEMYYAARRVHDSDRDSFTFWRQYYRPGKLHTSCALNQEAGIMGNVRFSHVYKIDIEVNGCGLKVVTYAAATMIIHLCKTKCTVHICAKSLRAINTKTDTFVVTDIPSPPQNRILSLPLPLWLITKACYSVFIFGVFK